ncbi:MAG: hypothetical protein ACK40G_04495 [Cytophagaceae bacterium]
MTSYNQLSLREGYWIILLLFSFHCFTAKVYSQDIESIGKEKPLKISGAFGTTQTFYTTDGIPLRRPPYQWVFTGNLNVDIYGLSIPISGFWSNQNREVRQPFNQYGVSPRYKWLIAHAGYRNLSFTPYTLAGHTFLGVGAEATPGIFRFGAMYGRLNKAVEEDTINSGNNPPSFRRIGYGIKAGIGKDGNFFDVIFFKAKDDINSLKNIPIASDVKPAENMVLSLNMQKRLGKRTLLSLEYANSFYTRDTRSPKKESAGTFSNLYTQNQSSQLFSAFKSALTYSGNFYSIAMGYERIEPEYRTLGAYFFNNDLENITVSPSIRLWKDKINLNANVGLQRNNVNNNKMTTTRRVLSSFNINYIPAPKWTFSGMYSNFTSYNRISNRFDRFQTLDTLNFYQVNENINFNAGYNNSGKTLRHGIMLNSAYQGANETYGENVTSNKALFFNLNGSYQLGMIPSETNLAIGISSNKNIVAGRETLAWGPTAMMGKTFWDKQLRTSINAFYNNVITDGKSTGKAINTVLSCGYNYLKKNTFTLNLMLLNRKGDTEANSFTEFTGTFGYMYNF